MKTQTAEQQRAAVKKAKEILSAYEISEHLKVDEVTASTYRTSQTIHYSAIYKVTHKGVTKKLSIEIKRDHFDSQSHARVSVWSTAVEGWNQVASLTPANSITLKKIEFFAEDPNLVLAERRMRIIAGTLITTAAEVIF